jgi:hypothetical protein
MSRDVAQPGRAQRSGRWGRWFKSSRPDHNTSNPCKVLSNRLFFYMGRSAPFFFFGSSATINPTTLTIQSRRDVFWNHIAATPPLIKVKKTPQINQKDPISH